MKEMDQVENILSEKVKEEETLIREQESLEAEKERLETILQEKANLFEELGKDAETLKDCQKVRA